MNALVGGATIALASRNAERACGKKTRRSGAYEATMHLRLHDPIPLCGRTGFHRLNGSFATKFAPEPPKLRRLFLGFPQKSLESEANLRETDYQISGIIPGCSRDICL
jgi:hypothetical protein